jgi:hypothetical protein
VKGKVIKKYLITALAVSGNIVLAWAVSRTLATPMTRGCHLALLGIGTGFLLVAGIGRLGWAIQTLGGESPAEILDRRLSVALSHIGTFALALDFFRP